MKHIFLALFIFSFFFSNGQGIEPSSVQPSPYLGGILKSVTPIVDEFTGNTDYLYVHDTLGAIVRNIFTDNDSLYFVVGSDTFNLGVLGGGVTGTGIATRVAFWNGTNSLSSDGNLYWDDANKRLGIGTTIPETRLNVTQNSFALPVARFDNTGTNGETVRIYHGASTDGRYTLKLETPASTTYFDTRGYLGLGTTPLYPLHVYSNSGISRLQNTTTNGEAGLDFVNPSNFWRVAMNAEGGTTNDLHFRDVTNGRYPFTIQSNGNVGVNLIVGATRQLDVNGDTRIRGAIYDSGNSSGSSGQVLTSAGAGAFTWTTPTVSDGSETKVTSGTNISVTGVGTIASPYVVNNTFTEVDGDINNEIQEIQKTGSNDVNIQITGGGGVGIENTLTNVLVPSNGSNGQILTKGSGTNYSWQDEVGDISNVTVSAPIVGGGVSGGVNIAIDTTSTTGVATQYDLTQIDQYQTISTSGAAGNITLSDGGGTLNLNVNDADADSANEYNTLVTSTYVGNLPAISITDGGGTRTGVIQVFSPSTAFYGSVPGANGATTSFLRGDGTWVANGNGTVTSVGITAGSGISVSESPITSSGSITVTNTGDLSATNEGSLTVGIGTPTTSVISSNTSGSTPVTLTAGQGVSISESGNVITIGNDAIFTVGATSGGTATLGPLDGDPVLTFAAGSGMTVTRSGTSGNAQTITFASTAGATDLGFTGSASPVTLTSSTGTDATITAGMNMAFSQASNNLTIRQTSPYTLMSVNAYNQALTTSNTKMALSGQSTTNGDATDINYDNTNDEIDILTTGTYHISYKCNCKSNTASVAVIFNLIDNISSGSLGAVTSHYFNNTNEYCHNNSEWIYPFTAGDRFSLYAKTASGTTTIQDCNIRVFAERVK